MVAAQIATIGRIPGDCIRFVIHKVPLKPFSKNDI